jgi:flagellar hook-basal body complex protein FliE
MDLLSPLSVQGHLIELQRTDPRHLSGSVVAGASSTPASAQALSDPESGFGRMFFDALNNVNELQHTTMDLTEMMLTDPDSVDIHDVTVAIAEANLALSMTKAIMDRAIRAYQEVINTR